MDLSVIVVSYNTRGHLARCLDSIVAKADGARAQLIVVDNASVDGSADMVHERFANVILVRNPHNAGFACAVNQGLGLAKGRYVLLLNSDARLEGDVLSSTVCYMDAHPDVGILGCPILNPDGSLQHTSIDEPCLGGLVRLALGTYRLRSLLRSESAECSANRRRMSSSDVEMVAGCFLCARHSALDEVGLLDEDFFFCGEDADWCRRFRESGWSVRMTPLGEVFHERNASVCQLGHKRHLLLADGLVRYHRKHYGAVQGFLAWLILCFFFANRLAFWSVSSLFSSREAAPRRNAYFRALLGMDDLWPVRKPAPHRQPKLVEDAS